MILYKFLSAKIGLKVLRERQVKVSRILELNDPFEFLGYDLRDKRLRNILKQYKDFLNNSHGVVCLSATWRHPLLWGHYANSHYGLCLGFDVLKEDYFLKVSYQPKRRAWPSDSAGIPAEAGEAELLNILLTKFAGWSYEAEHRAIYRLSDKMFDKNSGMYFTPFDEDLRLVKVIVGSASEVSRGEILEVVDAESVSIIKARPAFRSFRVVTQQKDPRWPLSNPPRKQTR